MRAPNSSAALQRRGAVQPSRTGTRGAVTEQHRLGLLLFSALSSAVAKRPGPTSHAPSVCPPPSGRISSTDTNGARSTAPQRGAPRARPAGRAQRAGKREAAPRPAPRAPPRDKGAARSRRRAEGGAGRGGAEGEGRAGPGHAGGGGGGGATPPLSRRQLLRARSRPGPPPCRAL